MAMRNHSSNFVDLASMTAEMEKLLDCPVCFKYMDEQIYMCVSGHPVCEKCMNNLERQGCHTCKQPFIRTRVRALEHISELVYRRCDADGCGALITTATKNRHAAECTARTVACVLCDWSGAMETVCDHVIGAHRPPDELTFFAHDAALAIGVPAADLIWDGHTSRLFAVDDWGRVFAFQFRNRAGCVWFCAKVYDTKRNADRFRIQLLLSAGGGAGGSYSGGSGVAGGCANCGDGGCYGGCGDIGGGASAVGSGVNYCGGGGGGCDGYGGDYNGGNGAGGCGGGNGLDMVGEYRMTTNVHSDLERPEGLCVPLTSVEGMEMAGWVDGQGMIRIMCKIFEKSSKVNLQATSALSATGQNPMKTFRDNLLNEAASSDSPPRNQRFANHQRAKSADWYSSPVQGPANYSNPTTKGTSYHLSVIQVASGPQSTMLPFARNETSTSTYAIGETNNLDAANGSAILGDWRAPAVSTPAAVILPAIETDHQEQSLPLLSYEATAGRYLPTPSHIRQQNSENREPPTREAEQQGRSITTGYYGTTPGYSPPTLLRTAQGREQSSTPRILQRTIVSSQVRSHSTNPRIGLHQTVVSPQGRDRPTAAALAHLIDNDQRETIGHYLFPLIQNVRPERAGKITGMLIEMDIPELLDILEHDNLLWAKVDEAVAVLNAHQIYQDIATAASRK